MTSSASFPEVVTINNESESKLEEAKSEGWEEAQLVSQNNGPEEYRKKRPREAACLPVSSPESSNKKMPVSESDNIVICNVINNVKPGADYDYEQGIPADESEEEWNEWEQPIITVYDSDEEVPKRKKRDPFYICHRCPTTRVGSFSDYKKFRFHIKRHSHGEIFKCPTCHQQFVNMAGCMAHEILVHETDIDPESYDRRDAMIREVMKMKEDGNTKNLLKFTQKGLRASTTLLPCSGSPVDHPLQAYEIHLTCCPWKYHPTSIIAKEAIKIHRDNVEEGRDVFRLGRFSKMRPRTRKS